MLDFFSSTQPTRSAIALRLLPSAFGIALKPTASINVHGAFPQKSIGGPVGATLGNAPYKIGDRTTRSAIAIKKKHRQSSVPVQRLVMGEVDDHSTADDQSLLQS